MICKCYSDGTKIWLSNDKYHRLDGPAIEYSSGTKNWYLDDKLHRDNGPAVEFPDGTKKWYLNGKRHRDNGPAIERPSGTKIWYINNKCHRVDGPAVEYSDGTKEWYLDGERLEQSEYLAVLKARKFRSKIIRFNYAFGFNLTKLSQLSQNKTIIEWYYSPNNGGGKIAKQRLEQFFGSLEV